MSVPSYIDPEKPPIGVSQQTWTRVVMFLHNIEFDEPIPPTPEGENPEEWADWIEEERDLDRMRSMLEAPEGINEAEWITALMYLENLN